MICPRCAYDSIDKLYTSPVPDVWDVLQCQQCLYCWRTSEPDRRTKREAYPQQFKMTLEDINNAPEVPTIPPLISLVTDKPELFPIAGEYDLADYQAAITHAVSPSKGGTVILTSGEPK